MMAVELRTVGRLVVRGTRRAALTVVGFALIALGIAGLVLPVLPGWLLIIAGFAVLSREYAWAQSGLAYARRKAAQGGDGVRSLAARWRRRREVQLPSADFVIDLAYAEAADVPEIVELTESEQTA